MLGRRFGDRRLVGAGMALMAAGGAVAALGGGANGIAAGRMVSGVGAVAMIILQGKIIADWFHGRLFMLALGISVGAFPVGLGLGQLLEPPLAHALGWQAPFWAGAAAMAIVAVLFVVSYRAPPDGPPPARHFSLPSRREAVLVLVAGLVWTAYTTGYTGYLSYLPSLMARRGDGLALTGLAMTIGTWGNVPGIMIGSSLIHRFGGLRVFLFGTLALVIGMAGTGLAGSAVLWAVVVGVLGAVHPSVIIAVGTLSARPENRAVGMGLFYTTYYAGNSVGPTVCGWVADRMGTPSGAMLAAACISCLAIPAYLLHRRMIPHAGLLSRA
jgi:MFS family permease